MKTASIALGIGAMIFLGACEQAAGVGSAEPVTLKPYNVETARKAQPEARESSVSRFEIAEGKSISCEPETQQSEPVEPETQDIEPVMEEPIAEEVIEVVVEEIPQEEPEEVVLESEPEYSEDYYVEELPPPAETFEQSGQYLGTYTVTWYSREEVGYDASGASGDGLTPYYSCAMPDYSLLGCTILVEGYGIYHVDDVSNGVCDLYVMYNSEIPSYGVDTADVYIVG